jgi:hypothetical protein
MAKGDHGCGDQDGAVRANRRVGKANGSRECAPNGVPTIQRQDVRSKNGGHGADAPLPTLRIQSAAERQRRCFSRLPQFCMLHHCRRCALLVSMKYTAQSDAPHFRIRRRSAATSRDSIASAQACNGISGEDGEIQPCVTAFDGAVATSTRAACARRTSDAIASNAVLGTVLPQWTAARIAYRCSLRRRARLAMRKQSGPASDRKRRDAEASMSPAKAAKLTRSR